MKNYFARGHEMEFSATATIASGDMVVAGSIVGIAAANYVSGDIGVMEIQGVYALTKGSETWDQGDKLYKTTGTQVVTKTASTNAFIGYAFAASASSATVGYVLLARPGS